MTPENGGSLENFNDKDSSLEKILSTDLVLTFEGGGGAEVEGILFASVVGVGLGIVGLSEIGCVLSWDFSDAVVGGGGLEGVYFDEVSISAPCKILFDSPQLVYLQ